MADYELSSRAQRDLRKIDRAQRTTIAEAIEGLASTRQPANLDTTPLVGRAPWHRLRVGNYRVIYRAIDDCYLIARIIHRRDLDRAVDSLR